MKKIVFAGLVWFSIGAAGEGCGPAVAGAPAAVDGPLIICEGRNVYIKIFDERRTFRVEINFKASRWWLFGGRRLPETRIVEEVAMRSFNTVKAAKHGGFSFDTYFLGSLGKLDVQPTANSLITDGYFNNEMLSCELQLDRYNSR